MKNLIIGVIALACMAPSFTWAQNCLSLRECQLRNQQLQSQVDYLKNENYNLFSQLNQCRLTSGPVNDGRLDLMFALQNKNFIGPYETPTCRGNCAVSEIRFIFINDTLKLQMETTGSFGISKRVVDLVIPDKYGEFVSIPHPRDVKYEPRFRTQCRYIVEKNSAGEVVRLTLLDMVKRTSDECPSKYWIPEE